MMYYTMLFVSLCLVGIIPITFIRGIVGPTSLDRNVVINVIGTKTVVIMVLMSVIFEEYFFIDVALVYALISFIATFAVAKYLERGKLV
ncbi:monovalent cation/H+ antiporter complex subunit F [Natronospora cellulosivora (SeqCode)]